MVRFTLMSWWARVSWRRRSPTDKSARIRVRSSSSKRRVQSLGTFRLYVNEGMWRHDQDSGMEPAIARWAVNLNEASGTKTCDFMSKLMSTRRHPSVTTWNQSISSSRPGQWTVERTLRTHSACRHIGSFRAPRSLKSKTPYCVRQVCCACMCPMCRYFTVKMPICQAILFLFISLQQMFSLSLGIVGHCEHSAPDIHSWCQTGRSCISQSPNCNLGYSSVIAV